FLTTAIFLTHGALQIPGGALADKFGAKKLVNIALLIITAGNVIIGLSNSYYAILLLKFIIGIGTGICFIAGVLLILWYFFAPDTPRAVTIPKIDWPSVFGSRNIWLLSLAQLATFGAI